MSGLALAVALAASEGFWATPVERLSLGALAADESDRPYSTPARTRDLAGGIALSCEYQEGRPCGDGAGAGVEMDSRAGYGDVLTATTRLRLWGGNDLYGHNFELDRAALSAHFGPVSLQLGRDVLTLGPAVRGSLMLSRNAAPQDGLRAELHPVPLSGWLKFSLVYFLDRLRDPQAFHGTLLECTRAQLDFFDHVQLGGSRFLEFGGDGAPDIGGLWGFVSEHFGRSTVTGAGSENNRLSFDLAVHFPLWRAYYEMAFEDTRKRFWNSLQYDADHLVGIELRLPVLVQAELAHTGWVSQEHSVFRAGMTSSGRTLGNAMGPDGTSLWIRAAIPVRKVTVSPWMEVMRFVSDRYDSDETRGVFVISSGELEHRQRVGADVAAPVAPRWTLTAGVFGERVANAAFVTGASESSLGARAALTWTP